MRLEKGHARELRHDFRSYYGLSYDETDIEEAIDLVHMLPSGSAYQGAIEPAARWDEEKYMLAYVMDALAVINWRLMRCPEELTPEPIERPGDKEQRKKAAEKSKSVREKIENTEWEEA